MKIITPDPETLHAAIGGNLDALDSLLRTLQPGVFNLALRMLGRREDAADATQEILLKVLTHLGSFRGEAAFTTWVFQVARNHLLTAAARERESPEVSFEAIAEKLQAGLDFAAGNAPGSATPLSQERPLTPEEKVAAREVALSCTQSMLMALDREHRLAYILDLLFGLSSSEAGEVMGIRADAYRQRLSRARERLQAFTQQHCALVNDQVACRCDRQLPALAHVRRRGGPPVSPLAQHEAERAQAERSFRSLVRLGDAAAVFRAHPEYQAPQAMLGAIRAVLQAEGFGDAPPPVMQ